MIAVALVVASAAILAVDVWHMKRRGQRDLRSFAEDWWRWADGWRADGNEFHANRCEQRAAMLFVKGCGG